MNNLDLEAVLLQQLVDDEEARACADRLRKQGRILADRMRCLSASFREVEPAPAPIAARELMLICREQHATLAGAPEVQWMDELGDESVNVDVEMMVTIFAELLRNAAAFSEGSPATIRMRRDGKAVTFELREPKIETLDPTQWARPFSKIRHGHYGLGLWSVRRLAKSHGAVFEQRYLPGEHELITRLSLPLT